MSDLLNAISIAKMFLSGAKNLQAKKEWINELNVFPVPDGDTGTNMTMTIMSAVDEVNKINDMNMVNLSKALSTGSLKGARGNSGVILSQLLRGFSKTIQNHNEVDKIVLANAFVKATETAYKAVMRPKEGTILTVAKAMSDKSVEISKEDISIEEFLEIIIKCGQTTLDKTPDMLPVLKEAGVVDSGGQGLMQCMYGAYNFIIGKDTDIDIIIDKKEPENVVQNNKSSRAEISTADIKFGYCTEFIVMLSKELCEAEKSKFRDYLLSIGDSLVFVADDEIIKIHVHTNHPGLAFEKAIEYGELTRMKIDNMREEHREIIEIEGYNKEDNYADKKNEPLKEYGFVAVAVGDGIVNVFKELGVDEVVEGGQTMNPSTNDIFDAINKVNAKNVYILPNNKNIIMASEQAANIIEDKNIFVIPTKSIPEGISAIIGYPGEDDPKENKNAMIESINVVSTGEVTYAVRDTKIDGFDISINDIMGICDGKMAAVGKDINNTTLELINSMINNDTTVISVYVGADTSVDIANELKNILNEKYKNYDVEFIKGNQPVYYYLISVE